MKMLHKNLLFVACFAALLLGCNTGGDTPQSPTTEPKKAVIKALDISDYLSMMPTGIFDDSTQVMDEEEKEKLVQGEKGNYWHITKQDANRIEMAANNDASSKVILQLFPKKDGTALVGIEIINGDDDSTSFWALNANKDELREAGRVLPDVTAADFVADNKPFSEDYEGDISYHLNDASNIEAVIWTKDDTEFAGRKVSNKVMLAWSGTAFTKSVSPK